MNMSVLNDEFLKEGVLLQTPEGFFVAHGPFEESDEVHSTNPFIYAPLFFRSKNHFLYPKKWSLVSRKELLDFFNLHQEKHCVSPWQEPKLSDFKKIFENFQKALKSRLFIKVVPVVFSKNTTPLTSRKRAFVMSNILRKKEGFAYGFWKNQEGMIGCTPEYLFEQKNSYVQTMALAGTSKKSDSHFEKDPKEIQEHQIVVEDILSRWQGFLFQKLSKSIQQFGDIQHFRTDIKIFGTHNLHFLDLIKKMHPTSALGGYPSREALLWLQSYNKGDRLRHGAPFAVCFSKEKSFCLVAIRNIQWKGSLLFLGSGCGLTRLSVLDKEWEELSLKRKSVMRLLWASKESL